MKRHIIPIDFPKEIYDELKKEAKEQELPVAIYLKWLIRWARRDIGLERMKK